MHSNRFFQRGLGALEILVVFVLTAALTLGAFTWARHQRQAQHAAATARQDQAMQAFAPMEALAKRSDTPLISQGLVEAVKRCTQTQADDGRGIPVEHPELWIGVTQRRCASEEVHRIALAQGESVAASAKAELQRVGFTVADDVADRPLQAPRPRPVDAGLPLWWMVL